MSVTEISQLPTADPGVGGFAARLSTGEWAALRLLGREFTVPAGATFVSQGDRPDRVVVLISGHAKLTQTSASGRETLLAIRDPGDLIGQQAVSAAGRVTAAATALTDIEALAVARSAFLSHLERAPRLMLALLQTMAQECVDLARRAGDAAERDTLGRLAGCLVELADRYGEPQREGTVIALPIRQDDLAAWICSSRAGTQQALRTCRELGWIRTSRGRIVIDDPHALRRRAI